MGKKNRTRLHNWAETTVDNLTQCKRRASSASSVGIVCNITPHHLLIDLTISLELKEKLHHSAMTAIALTSSLHFLCIKCFLDSWLYLLWAMNPSVLWCLWIRDEWKHWGGFHSWVFTSISFHGLSLLTLSILNLCSIAIWESLTT